MNEMLNVSSNPHVRDKGTTSGIMRDVLIALLPATVVGVCVFGIRALVLILVTVASAVATEAIYEKLMHKKISVNYIMNFFSIMSYAVASGVVERPDLLATAFIVIHNFRNLGS